MEVKDGTGRACSKGNQCAFSDAGGLKVCNSMGVSLNDDSASNGVNNLICVKNAATGNSTWTDIENAVLAIPYTPSQTKLLSCDANRACATEGDSCVDATGGRIFCHNNLWLTDPKYDKSTWNQTSYQNGRSDSTSISSNDKDEADTINGGGTGGGGVITDNYYTINHFYGPSNRENDHGRRDHHHHDTKKNVSKALHKVATKASGAYDAIKSAIAPPLPKQMNYGTGSGGAGGARNAVGNTVVPLIVPKGEIATVKPYEATIQF